MSALRLAIFSARRPNESAKNRFPKSKRSPPELKFRLIWFFDFIAAGSRKFQSFSAHAALCRHSWSLFSCALYDPQLHQPLAAIHNAIQVPLRVDLDAAPVVQASQALVVADIAEHGLYGANALAVQLPSSG